MDRPLLHARSLLVALLLSVALAAAESARGQASGTAPAAGTSKDGWDALAEDQKALLRAVKQHFTDTKYIMITNFERQKLFDEMLDDWVQSGQIKFGTLDPGTNGEYYRSAITISNQTADELAKNKRFPSRQREAEDYHLVVDLAQCLVHEFQHASDDAAYYKKNGTWMEMVTGPVSKAGDDWSDTIESAGWSQGMKAVEQWIRDVRMQHLTHPTRETAMKLSKLTTNWLAYDDNMKATKHEVLFDHETPKGGVVGHEEFRADMERLKAKTRDEWAQFEILSSYVGPPPLTGKETLDELIERLPPGLGDENDLRAFLEGLATVAVSQRAGMTASELSLQAKPDLVAKKARERVDKYYAGLRERYDRRRKEAEKELPALADKLRSLPLTLRYTPDPAYLDPQSGSVSVTAGVDPSGQQQFEQVCQEIRALLRSAKARQPQVTVKDTWSEVDSEPSDYEFTAPGTYPVELTRVVTISAKGIPSNSPLNRIVVITRPLKIVVSPNYPEDIAGRWTGGSFVITGIPALDQVDLNRLPEAEGVDKEGCTIQLEKLKKLIGKSAPMEFEIRPQPPTTGGVVVFTVTPPTDVSSEPPKPHAVNYRYVDGVFTASDSEKGATSQFRGQFVRTPTGWTLKGTWQSFGEKDGRRILAVVGTWSGSKADAKPAPKPGPKPGP